MSSSSIISVSTGQDELQELLGLILGEAESSGASQAEAAISLDTGISVTVRHGEVETLEYQRDRGLGVTVYLGQRKGSASTADLSEAAVRETVQKAASIARYTAEDPYAGLADAEMMARDIMDLDLCHPWDLTPESAIDIATDCERAALNHDVRIKNSEGATLASHQGLRVYGNSHGFSAGYPTTNHTLSCVVLAEHGTEKERDYWYATSRVPGELENATDIGVRAAERTLRRLNARKLTTREAPVLFAADVARGLIGHFVAAIRGGSQYRQSTFLLGAQGQEVFPKFLNIAERPHIPRALASAPFDSEGVATRDRDLVKEGVLQGYVLSSYSARKLGLQTTGNAGGAHNLLVSSGELDYEGLVKSMGTGLIVTELMGQGVNPVTGDYSRGAAGLWVEGGEIAYPAHEITIASTLPDMYANIRQIGRDVDTRGGIHTGSILIGNMTIAGD